MFFSSPPSWSPSRNSAVTTVTSRKSRRSPAARLLLVALALLALTTLSTAAFDVPNEGSIPHVTGYMRMPWAEVVAGTTQFTAAAAQTWCNDHGASLVADTAEPIALPMWEGCFDDAMSLCTTFIDGSAKPRVGSRSGCVEGKNYDGTSATETENSQRCTYRWRFGLYDAFAETAGPESNLTGSDYEPGLRYYWGLYWDDPNNYTTGDRFLNGFLDHWNYTRKTRLYYPIGKYRAVMGMAPNWNNYWRSDSGEVAVHNSPNPLASYTVHCSFQADPPVANSTTRLPQPTVIRGYTELPWAEQHWWVIFLIVTAIILLLLMLIIIYCPVAWAPKEDEPFLPALVQREREGKPYANVDNDVKPEPEPDTAATPPTDGLREDTVSVADGEEGETRAPAIRSRRSFRPARSGTFMQTFSEVDVPMGGEISEMDVEL